MAFDTSLIEKVYKEKKEKREKRRIETMQKALTVLKDYFSKKKMTDAYLFGSLIHPNQFYERSDIDIAVRDIPTEKYFAIRGDLEQILGTENIDLVELEKCRFEERILKEGLKIL